MKIWIGIGIVIVILLVGVVLLGAGKGFGGTVREPILMTDPPNVPAGTQALLVTYSNLSVHTSGTNQSGWVSAAGSGTVNLLAVQNSTQVIGYANVQANSTINLIRFSVTSASITINGTAHSVRAPNNTLTVAVTGQQKINQTTGVLIDMFATVTTSNAQGNVTYTMAPAARAIVVANMSAAVNANIGSRININSSLKSTLNVGLGIH